MRTLSAILLGKAISALTKRLKIGGGSAAPGLYALKLDHRLVEKLSSKIPKNIVITGTNGKTTTARMLAHFAKISGLKVIRNHTGSNMERGIASTLIQNVSLRTHLKGGKLNYDLGIWEVDEAAFNALVPKINPDVVIFLNAFRDQLDRYGEVDSVVKKWEKTLQNLSKDSMIIVNGDDANTMKLKNCFKGRVLAFGVKDSKITGENNRGKAISLDIEAKNITQNGLEEVSFETVVDKKSYKTRLPLPGIYNVYNFLAAFAVSEAIGVPADQVISTLGNLSPAFGRVEKFTIPSPHTGQANNDGYIFLIKNPIGATQVFKTIAPQLKSEDRLLMALNDNLADGTDVSWIWDAEFEKLLVTSDKLLVTCSGIRAHDLALRLKYAGFSLKNIIIEPGLENALKQARTGLKGRLFILPTYTAMLELQHILAKSGIKKKYWEENN